MNEAIYVYTGIEEIKNKVYEDYKKESTELNSLFFDFYVKAPKKDLLEAYAEIQDTINGDKVMRLENPKIKGSDDRSRIIISGNEVDLIPEGMYEDVYEGNYKDFLESFNYKESGTGLCRVMDVEKKEDNLIIGTKLDFIF